MIAGFQRHVHGRASCCGTGLIEGVYLGVTVARTNMITLANRLAVAGDNGSNHRVRRDGIPTALREVAGAFH